MSLWRREALERFPELHRDIANVEGVFLFWHILRHQMLLPAYEKEPPDLETAARVFDYAAWCWTHRSPLVRLAVADEFYDYLGDYPKTRAEMPRWLSLEQFDEQGLIWLATYMTPEDFAAFRREFLENRKKLGNQRIWHNRPLS
jgi:hypothetical protein